MIEDRDKNKFNLRLPDGMRDRIRMVAEANGRSMNAEIVYRLQTTLEMDDYRPGANVNPETYPTEAAAIINAEMEKVNQIFQALLDDINDPNSAISKASRK